MADLLKYKYGFFLEKYEKNLKQIFHPIKEYFKNKSQIESSYLFFKKYDIVLKKDGTEIEISNYKTEFAFSFQLEDIKKIRLYYTEKEYKEFWTCGNEFTRYYFKNCIKERICMKDDDNYKSVDFENEENLQKESYYLCSKNDFNFQKNIHSVLNIDWNNPPEELNFMIQKGNYCSKYKKQNIEFKDGKSKTFFHNAKLGISLSIIKSTYEYYKGHLRTFYFNCNYIFESDDYNRKKYFLYFLNFLFFKDESETANNFLLKIYYDFNKYNNNLTLLFKDIVNCFKNDENIFIIFDDIHSDNQYSDIEKIKKNAELNQKDNILIREFIEINNENLPVLKKIVESNGIRNLKIIGTCENKTIYDDLNIIREFVKDNENYLSLYKKKIENKLDSLFKNYSVNKYLNLIKLFYYLNADKISKETLENIILLDEIKDFTEFLYIKIFKDFAKIEFRNKIIEYYFNNYYNYYSNIFLLEQSKKCIKQLLGSEQGYNFERHIIFSIIIGNMTNKYFRVNINKIYCLGKINTFKFKENIIFYQTIQNAPLYDFAVLIKNNEGKYILKVYQVSIYKPEEDLNKLYKLKIIYDLSYFIEKINTILNIEIEGFSFGIITSFEKYYDEKNKNGDLMFDFCQENDYEFLLYNIDKNTFYNFDKIVDKFKKVKSFEEINLLLFKPIKIFKNDCNIYKKYYIEKINPIPAKKLITDTFDSITNKKLQIKLELVGKYDCDISVFEQNKELIFYYSLNDDQKIYIYYNNYKLYQNPKKSKGEEGDKRNNKIYKKKILVFQIENSNILKDEYFSKFKKKQFIINNGDKQQDINYLISDGKDEIKNFYDEDENIALEDSKEENDSESKTEVFEEKQIDISDETNSQEKKGLIEFKDNIKKNDYSMNEEQSSIKNNSNDEDINFNSNEFNLYKINSTIYEKLLEGNKEIYKKLINQIKITDKNNEIQKKEQLLGKKRKKRKK